MRILVTGSEGFVGKNLTWNLREIMEGKNRTRPDIHISEINTFDIDSDENELEEVCEKADFVLHFAGVNRPKQESEYIKGNYDFTSRLLDVLKDKGNICPVLFASSIQASLEGRYAGSEYGKSKLLAEEKLFEYGEKTGARVLVYRFPNLFGKWCRPNYNSVVATFCNAIANNLDYTVDNPDTRLELLYIDDLVESVFDAIEGKEKRCEYDGLKVKPKDEGRYCYVPITHTVTLGHIIDTLKKFKNVPNTLTLPDIPDGSFEKKLYSTYLTYLPESALAYKLDMKVDSRGIFTELLKSVSHGQVSINIARPGITRGEHWHNSKWEIFVVVSGHGLIRERKIGINPETGTEYPVIEFEVSGEQMKAIQMIPGYTHSIVNLSDSEDLVTVMWANEQFDEQHPDTFYEPVIASEG